MTLERLVSIITALGTISAGLYFLYKEYKKRQYKYRQRANGIWTNEGNVNLSKIEMPFVTLEMAVDAEDGEIIGLIQSNAAMGNLGNYISVNGYWKYKSGYATLRMSNRALTIIGTVKLKFNGKLIRWELKDKNSELFPTLTILHKL